jgi:hypothetical protein
VKTYTSHLRGEEPPVLVAESFSVWGALFGWLWLLCHRAWIPAALVFAASLLVGRAAHLLSSTAPILGLMLLQGLFARDLQRWGLVRRGYIDGPIVAGADRDTAFARLIDDRADLRQALAGTTR